MLLSLYARKAIHTLTMCAYLFMVLSPTISMAARFSTDPRDPIDLRAYPTLHKSGVEQDNRQNQKLIFKLTKIPMKTREAESADQGIKLSIFSRNLSQQAQNNTQNSGDGVIPKTTPVLKGIFEVDRLERHIIDTPKNVLKDYPSPFSFVSHIKEGGICLQHDYTDFKMAFFFKPNGDVLLEGVNTLTDLQRFCRICVLQIKMFLFWQIFIHTKPSSQRSFRKLIDLVSVH